MKIINKYPNLEEQLANLNHLLNILEKLYKDYSWSIDNRKRLSQAGLFLRLGKDELEAFLENTKGMREKE